MVSSFPCTTKLPSIYKVPTPDSLSEMRTGSHIGIVRKDLGELSVDKVLEIGNVDHSGIDNGGKVHTGSQGSGNNVVNNVPVSINPNVWPCRSIGEGISGNFGHYAGSVLQSACLFLLCFVLFRCFGVHVRRLHTIGKDSVS